MHIVENHINRALHHVPPLTSVPLNTLLHSMFTAFKPATCMLLFSMVGIIGHKPVLKVRREGDQTLTCGMYSSDRQPASICKYPEGGAE